MINQPPKWQRKGFKSKAEYDAACAAKRKTEKAAMLATKTKKNHKYVLKAIWARAEFEEPICTFTKQQIMGDVGCGLKTVQRALAELRAEGSLHPIDIRGGYKTPARYRLRVAGQTSTPSDKHIHDMQEAQKRDAAWNFLKDKFGPLKALEMMGEPDAE